MGAIGDMANTQIVHRTYDDLLDLEDGTTDFDATKAAKGGATTGLAYLDLGTGLVEGMIRIDVTSCEVATGDENYRVGVQLSSVTGFGSDMHESQALELGDATTLEGDTDLGVGQYNIPFRNEVDGTVYRYMRLNVTVAGTIDSTGLKFRAYLAKATA